MVVQRRHQRAHAGQIHHARAVRQCVHRRGSRGMPTLPRACREIVGRRHLAAQKGVDQRRFSAARLACEHGDALFQAPRQIPHARAGKGAYGQNLESRALVFAQPRRRASGPGRSCSIPARPRCRTGRRRISAGPPARNRAAARRRPPRPAAKNWLRSLRCASLCPPAPVRCRAGARCSAAPASRRRASRTAPGRRTPVCGGGLRRGRRAVPPMPFRAARGVRNKR